MGNSGPAPMESQIVSISDDSGEIETIPNPAGSQTDVLGSVTEHDFPLSPFSSLMELQHTEIVDSILPKEIKERCWKWYL